MKYCTAFLLTFGWAFTALAQPGNLGQLELKVTDKYKARVGEASKVTDFPDFKDTTTSKIPVKYSIVSQPIEVKFNPDPIQPARIAKIPVDELYNGMVRVGYGLYNTPLAEAYYNSGRSSKYSYGFSGQHFSTQKGVKDIVYENNGMSRNGLKAYFNRFFDDLTWENNAYARFDKVSYYGLDVEDTTRFAGEEETPEPPSNWYRQFGIQSKLVSPNDKAMGWTRKLGIDYYFLSDDYFTQENNFKLLSSFAIPAQEETIDLDVNLNYFNTVYDSLADFDQSYFTLQMRPHIETYVKDFLFKFGLNLYYNSLSTSLSDESDGNLYFFPEIKVSYPIVEDVLTTYAGIEGHLQHNTVRSLVDENPFIDPGQFLTPTRTTDIYIGMNGIISSTTSFNLRGGFKDANGLVLFYRNPFYAFDSIDPGISVLYDDADIFYASGELAVNLKNNLQLNLGGTLQSFQVKNAKKAWHRPAFTAKLGAGYTIKEKIRLKADIRYVGPRVAFNQADNPLIDSDLPGYVNANLGVEYLYNSRLSAFINVYNLLNTPYDYYLGYQAQNINVLFGIGYRF